MVSVPVFPAALASQQYVWSLRYIDAAVCRDEDTNGDGDCLDDPNADPNSGGSRRLFYSGDGNFNTTALIDGNPGSATLGAAVERYLYDPYGAVIVYRGFWGQPIDWDSPYNTKNELLFCGYRYDPETMGYFC